MAALALAGGIYADWYRAAPPEALARATYVGRQACVDCHQQQHADWTGSHHDRAMELASEASVLGDFDNGTFERLGVTTRFFRDGDRFMVNTEGPDGEMTDFEVKYTFGVDPLQQYMVEFDDGRVQVLRVSWDTHGKQWFYVPPPDVPNERLQPDDPTHWTGIAQNWNTTCAICHSTNLQKNYDLATDTYDTTYSEIDVSCEECHGPASLHIELASANSLFWDRRHGYGLARLKSEDSSIEIEACAKCHSRRNAVHGEFRPGTPLLDSYEPVTLQAGLYHADGQILDEVYVYGSFLQSKMHAKGVRCSDCHNPHSLQLEHPGNQMCAKCHEPAKYDVVAHHHHPDPAPGEPSVGAQCVECHMPSTTYMVLDPRRDHSFRIPRPDLSVKVGTPNACNGCHQKPGETPEWAAAKVEEWFGAARSPERENEVGPREPHWAPAFAAGRASDPAGEELLIEIYRDQTTPPIVQATAIELLGQYGSPAVSAIVQNARNSASPLVRLAGLRATTAVSAQDLASKIAGKLSDPSRVVRIEAARRLAGLSGEVLTTSQREALAAALEEYRERQSLDADRADSHLNLAGLAQQLGEPSEAIAELQTALRLAPYRSTLRYELALLLEQNGGDPEAVRKLREEEAELLERDMKLLPENSDVRYRLGMLQYKLGNLAAAEVALTEACRVSPQSYQCRFALALLQEARFMKTEQEVHFQAAVESLEILNRLNPDDRNAKAILQRMIAAKQALDK